MATVEIYTTPLCGYCHAAKRLLKSKDVSYAETDVSADPELRADVRVEALGDGQQELGLADVRRFLGAEPAMHDVEVPEEALDVAQHTHKAAPGAWLSQERVIEHHLIHSLNPVVVLSHS